MRVLLVAAGPAEGPDAISNPLLWPTLLGTEIDWAHQIVEQTGIGRHHGAPKHGDTLLAGLIRCKRCGRKLTVRYNATVVTNAELAGAEFFEPEDSRQIILIAAEIGALMAFDPSTPDREVQRAPQGRQC